MANMGEAGEEKIHGIINKLEDNIKGIISLNTESIEKFPGGKNVWIKGMNILKKSSEQLNYIHSSFHLIVNALNMHPLVKDQPILELNLDVENDLKEAKHLPDIHECYCEDKMVGSINELEDILREITYLMIAPRDVGLNKFPRFKKVRKERINILIKSLPKLEHIFVKLDAILTKLDSHELDEQGMIVPLETNLDQSNSEKVRLDENDLNRIAKLPKNIGSHYRSNIPKMERIVFGFWGKLNGLWGVFERMEISKEAMNVLQLISEYLIIYLPKLNDPCYEIDHILYKNDTPKVVESEMDRLLDPEQLFYFYDDRELIHATCFVYFYMVFDQNIVNQCLDNAFLKLVEHRGWRRILHLDGNIVDLLESKDMYKICLGLKLCKTYSNANGFKDCIEQDLYCAISDLSKIPEFVGNIEKEMSRFVAKHAKGCHDLIKEKNKLPKIPANQARDILKKITIGKMIGQYEISALYEFIKSCKSSSKVLSILLGYGKISNVVYIFLRHIKYFFKRYEELDKEMREIDEQNGQELGGFSLEIVADYDVKKPLCASDGLKDSTFNKYFFYDDAMKTFSILSFLYNCFEKDVLYSYEAQHFKLASFLTNVVLDLIRQCDELKKVNQPIWIMEKILKTCHFIVFGQDEKEEKDIFLKLVNQKEIDEEELKLLKWFMEKNNLSYEDIKRDIDTLNE